MTADNTAVPDREALARLARETGAHAYTNRFAKDEPAFAFSVDKLERFAAALLALQPAKPFGAPVAAEHAEELMRLSAQAEALHATATSGTAAQCPTCSDRFPARSYGAGFLDAAGQCENCAAGMPMQQDASGVPDAWAVVNSKGAIINTCEVRELLAAPEGCDRAYPEDAPHRVEPLRLGSALRWPQTPADVRAFIGPHFCALNWGSPADQQPHENDHYEVSAHDLLSAFRDWAEVGAAPAAAQPAQDATDAARYRWLRNEAVRFGYDDESLSPWAVIGKAHDKHEPCEGAELDTAVDAGRLAVALAARGVELAGGAAAPAGEQQP